MTSVRTGAAKAASVWETLKQEIKAAGPELGIDDIGFASADPFVSLKSLLEQSRDKGYASGFEESDIEKRVHPALPGGEPASLIAIAVAYPSKMINPPKSEPGAYRGIFARSAWGQDYHQVLRTAMDKLVNFIRERVPEAMIESMVDTGALVDRAVSQRAGIGFSAKNCSIISPKFGSWIFLGELVTNIPFPPDTPVTEDCGECTKCIDACPTGALVGPGQLNAQRCISFLTQTKGFLDEEFMLKIGNRLYGCDTCQIVCPKNRGKNWDHHPEFHPDPEVVKPLLLPLLDIGNREFKERFGQSSASWRGKKPIQRNAVIALGNFKDKSAVPKLTQVLKRDPRPELRGTAAWALSRIGGEDAMRAIGEAAAIEQDGNVLSMLQKAKERLMSSTALPEQPQAGNASKLDSKSEGELERTTETNGEQPASTDKSGEAAAWKPSPVTGLHGKPVYYDELLTPIGTLTLCATDEGLCHIDFGAFHVREAHLQQWARTWIGEYRYEKNEEKLSEAAKQLREYFAGERKTFDLQLERYGTAFQLQVWQVLSDISYGEALTHQEVAEKIGRPKAVRAVLDAISKNPIPIVIPCHRMSGKDGTLVGYVGGLQTKEQLLTLEQQT
ncbi:tRNA epoxyqueuosine(34) reductase QueG [Paenibacillus silvae]|uniref:tRNA epoxyqueuosine(34) reductase QueG n=1 Tax=Paenibacillus silvae TaxID=1325358 RepID=UPI0011A051F5|nr:MULTISPECIES: tRNA epoxyqueuosine(34) reductase QueG [Paenibacillus]MCK6078069.1 tRNA epoxyqueuosine(34) reductase QueG [Paenibacillus silvae]MCK6152411.1 tRNA epoxyqueuosine(34) reductase QueG [Paenibacillus silvae]MCK6270952.1 tRNA epoxyqueuosine(34) reductase QueG [Paenibacillus silvae]